MGSIQYRSLQEELFFEQLPNGLRVYVLPKRGYHKTFAAFSTYYGSNDSSFRVGDGEVVQTPDGVAHFLEHKLFEQPDGSDVFREFSLRGASSNAFTTYNRTSYLFSCTQNLYQNLEILLSFVQQPYFTDANVAKEQGIIGQEIRMYDDAPDWQVYVGLMQSLYHNHPVRGNIIGTIESIAGITKEVLYACYETFYHPSNMILFIVGCVEPEGAMEIVRAHQAQREVPPAPKISRVLPGEPDTVIASIHEKRLSVGIPHCLLGCKEAVASLPSSGDTLMRQEWLTELALGAILGSSSQFYQDLYDAGLIDGTFGVDYTLDSGYGHVICGGQTSKPSELVSRLQEGIQKACERGIDRDAFRRLQRKKLGDFLHSWDILRWIADRFVSCQFLGADPFVVPEMVTRLQPEEADERIRSLFAPERMATSVVVPNAVME
ncbi:EF-P 5-aminopentanol modification-associated protein YfmH [Pasteuria penetrans]|uniref:EF-P 5-aminopentanol modification-associated protein YfmH n=1 Tax=Pasteuria penetrans TaxID=86005 RepID=UPI000FBD0904|nr:pitrilysin family protein [Pasteuria penetrans]